MRGKESWQCLLQVHVSDESLGAGQGGRESTCSAAGACAASWSTASRGAMRQTRALATRQAPGARTACATWKPCVLSPRAAPARTAGTTLGRKYVLAPKNKSTCAGHHAGTCNRRTLNPLLVSQLQLFKVTGGLWPEQDDLGHSEQALDKCASVVRAKRDSGT
jgi:hypothetical protein